MTGTDSDAHRDRGPDAVEQVRAWLVERTGQAPDAIARADGDATSADRGIRTDRGYGLEGDISAHEATRTDRATRTEGRSDRGSRHSERDDPADPDADHETVARTIALRKLTAQARTRHELDQALRKKNVSDEVAASVLDRLEEVGLLDDEAFAQDWVTSRQQRRHLSRSALRRELQGKGVERDHVDSALAAVDAEDELAAARALAAKKARPMRGLEPAVRRRRLAGVLARRGFGPGIVGTVLGEIGVDGTGDPGA